MNSNQRERFWLVWCPSGGAPTVKHHTPQSAEKEAARLATANPGVEFYALTAFAGFCKPVDEPNRLEIMDADVPW